MILAFNNKSVEHAQKLIKDYINVTKQIIMILLLGLKLPSSNLV